MPAQPYNLVKDDHENPDLRIPVHADQAFFQGIRFSAKLIGWQEVTRPNTRAEIVAAMRRIRFGSYRFSIAWSRIMPTGEPSSLNQAGLDYYHNLIDALLENGIVPSVTMYHWDLPQPIQDLGGFLNPIIVDYFEAYADLLFREYGHKVKDWCTFNEPVEICEVGYDRPSNPPFVNGSMNGGVYYCGYHLLLAHARTYYLYSEKYRPSQEGKVGIVYSYNFYYPADGKDYALAERGMQYTIGMYAHPVFTEAGGWPSAVIEDVDRNSAEEGRIWSRLPVMNDVTKAYIRGTADWLGLNYYSSFLVERDPDASLKAGIDKDKAIIAFKDEEWETAESEWLHRVPEGFRDAINFIGKHYNKPEIQITENGWSDVGLINDGARIRYFREHLKEVLKVNKCDELRVTRFYAWSIMDNFEWMAGYTKKFGLFQVDFKDPQRPRKAKDSVRFFEKLCKTRIIPEDM